LIKLNKLPNTAKISLFCGELAETGGTGITDKRLVSLRLCTQPPHFFFSVEHVSLCEFNNEFSRLFLSLRRN
jgi:hypothetical protein